MMKTTIYKIVPQDLWAQAEKSGIFEGAAVDISVGYIHFSTGEQERETAAKYFAGKTDLLLVSVDAAKLLDKLVYEVYRGRALFTLLYVEQPMDPVTKV